MTDLANDIAAAAIEPSAPAEFDYDNPPYVHLTTLNASLIRYNGDMKTGSMLLTFRVNADAKPLAIPITDYPQQELRLTVERIDYPDLVQQEPGDADGEWGNVNYPDGGWRGGRKTNAGEDAS